MRRQYVDGRVFGDGTSTVATGTTSITVTQVELAVFSPSPIAPGGGNNDGHLHGGKRLHGNDESGLRVKASPSGAQSLPPARSIQRRHARRRRTTTTKLTINTTAASAAF